MKTTFLLMFHGVGNAWPRMEHHSRLPLNRLVDRPSGNTSVSLLLIREGQIVAHILVDFGEGAFESIMKAGLPPPDVTLLTHLDIDHANPMQLDAITRYAKVRKMSLPRLGCTSHTFASLPEFQRKGVMHVELKAGQMCSIEAGSEVLEIFAVDASTHRAGGLNFVVRSVAGSVAFAFDVCRWPKDLSVFDGVDVIIAEANSVYPMSARTGHTSLAESVAAIRDIPKPPRYSVFLHYGHDDADVLTQGSLQSLLRGLAPDLAASVAWAGMVLDSTHLPARDPVAVIDARTALVVEVREKADVHAQGLLHTSVILAVRARPGYLRVYRRHDGQSYAGATDLFGGHGWEAAARLTAVREGFEELRPMLNGVRVCLDATWLTDIGQLESFDHSNRERSFVYGVTLPEGVTLHPADTGSDGVERSVECYETTLLDLTRMLEQTPTAVADGLRRVLESSELRERLSQFLES